MLHYGLYGPFYGTVVRYVEGQHGTGGSVRYEVGQYGAAYGTGTDLY